MKYKVGDKVLVKTEEQMKEQFGKKWNYPNVLGRCFADGMKQCHGKIVTINNVDENTHCYSILEDECIYDWTDEMFLPIDPFPVITISVKNNKVIARKEDGKTGVARCHPDDEFNYETGAKLAIERLFRSWPQPNDTFYTIVNDKNDDWIVEEWCFSPSIQVMKDTLKKGNCFQTKTEANKKLKQVKDILGVK